MTARSNPPGKDRRGNSALLSSIDVSDILSDGLRMLGLRTRVFCRSSLGAPWTLQMSAGDYQHFHVLERGSAFLLRENQEPLELAAGDLVVLTRGDGHQLSSRAAPRGRALQLAHAKPGHCNVVQQRGSHPLTETLCGAFTFARDDARLLTSLLPEVIHVPARTSEPMSQLLRLLWQEFKEPRLGSAIITERLTDAIFVHTIRIAAEKRASEVEGWLGALRDPKIAAALARLHRDPAYTWTVESLAGAAGMSRSRFAARFRHLLSVPPLTYVTKVRIHRAAEDLRTTSMSIKEIAVQAGYESETAFNKIFRREMGVTPGAYRRSRTRSA